MSTHDDATFVRNFSMVLVGLTLIGILAFVLAKIVNSHFQETQSPNDPFVERIAPMGAVNTGSEAVSVDMPVADAAPAEAAAATADAGSGGAQSGQAVYDSVCFACHAQGIAGAPKYGDMAAWEERVARGRDANVANAINGYTGSAGLMPARGGNPSLSDEEVAAAVDYMLAAVGGEAPAEAPAATEAAPAAEAAPAEAEVAAADSARGKEVYDAACFVCHTPGAAGAPKIGDAANWGPRVDKGVDTLYSNAINGYMGDNGMMPPKGGRPDFSDDDVKAAVDYMVSNSK